MSSALTFLSGKKTYIIAFVAAATAGAQAMGYHIPDWVYALEAALGIGAVRVAISSAGGNYITSENVTGPVTADTVNVTKANVISGPK